MSLHESDKLRFIGFSEAEISALRIVVLRGWRLGIQSEGPLVGCWQFKLMGKPWQGQSQDSISAHTLILSLLTHLLQNSYTLKTPTKISKTRNDHDTFLFSRPVPSRPLPTPPHLTAISFTSSNIIRLINGSQSLNEVIRAVIIRHWPQGLQSHGKYFGETEFKLQGSPWWSVRGEESVQARVLVMRILEVVEGSGFDVLGSVDVCGKDGDGLDSWILRRV
ncbi:hypothetical protein HDV00_005516 [Rhizophlyctis rosea]|nr:hypothetical protein HDV00_005516 [Rhizophlyctis rosea]